jgi:hypothetical protein
MQSPSQRLCRNSGSSVAKVTCAEMFRPRRRLVNSSGSQQNVANAERPKSALLWSLVNFVSTVGNLFVLRPLDCSFLP